MSRSLFLFRWHLSSPVTGKSFSDLISLLTAVPQCYFTSPKSKEWYFWYFSIRFCFTHKLEEILKLYKKGAKPNGKSTHVVKFKLEKRRFCRLCCCRHLCRRRRCRHRRRCHRQCQRRLKCRWKKSRLKLDGSFERNERSILKFGRSRKRPRALLKE